MRCLDWRCLRWRLVQSWPAVNTPARFAPPRRECGLCPGRQRGEAFTHCIDEIEQPALQGESMKVYISLIPHILRHIRSFT